MGGRPPTHLPRLAELDAAAVAEEVCAAVREDLRSRLERLGLGEPAGDLERLRQAVRQVVELARDGVTDADEARRVLELVEGALGAETWPRLEQLVEVVGWESRPAWGPQGKAQEPVTRIGIALLALRGRVAIAERKPVTLRELAAVAEMSYATIRQYATAIPAAIRRSAAGDVAPAEASRFLRERGVAA